MPLRFARGRIPRPGRTYASEGMNKLEAEYAARLELEKQAGLILDYKYEAINLRLAARTFFKCDFFVIDAQGLLSFHEVKGHWEDDARAKIKVAAAQYPYFQFVAVQKKKGQWVEEHF